MTESAGIAYDQSDGLSIVVTYCYWDFWQVSYSELFATSGIFESLAIYLRTEVLSAQKTELWSVNSSSCINILSMNTARVAAASSFLGIVFF